MIEHAGILKNSLGAFGISGFSNIQLKKMVEKMKCTWEEWCAKESNSCYQESFESFLWRADFYLERSSRKKMLYDYDIKKLIVGEYLQKETTRLV